MEERGKNPHGRETEPNVPGSMGNKPIPAEQRDNNSTDFRQGTRSGGKVDQSQKED